MPTPLTGDDAPFLQEELQRYQRHFTLPDVGAEGQQRLRQASVLCIGAGGLGSPLTMYLAAAGVGRIGLVDFDHVDLSNLQRQILHGTEDVGRLKVDSARDSLLNINPHLVLETHAERLDADNAAERIGNYDIVADGTDNFPTRYLVNDACVLLGKPNAYASIFRFEGRASVFGAPNGPCYRCLYPEPPPPDSVPNCAEGGVLGVLPGLLGTIQATEVIKLILGKGRPLIGRVLLVDALEMSFRELKLRCDPQCPVCGDQPTITTLRPEPETCEAPMHDHHTPEIDPRTLKARLEAGDDLYLLDVREQHEYDLCKLEGSHLIPLGDLQQRLNELNPAHEIVVYCRVGGRSAAAVHFLRESGFPRVLNLAGGTHAWSRDVDPSMPLY